MADSYSFVKSGKLRLKGEKKKSKKHKKHKRKREHEEEPETNQDTAEHGGWWAVSEFEEISGQVAIEFGSLIYMEAQDDGLFLAGEKRNNGEEPDPAAVLTAIRATDTKIALKSGYEKYLGINANGIVVGRSDAIGSREQWEPVFQEGKLALLGSNNCFLTIGDNRKIVCESRTAGEDEMIQIRTNAQKAKKSKDDVPDIEKGRMKDVEVNFVKQFQSFQDRRLRVNTESRSGLKKAKKEGDLHEVLLDRREKMKSDRYCK